MDVGKQMLFQLLKQIRENHRLYLKLVKKKGTRGDPMVVEYSERCLRDWETYYTLKEIYKKGC